jgi:hypothetical protein
MQLSFRLALTLLGFAACPLAAPSLAQTVVTISTSAISPTGVAIGPGGNLFVVGSGLNCLPCGPPIAGALYELTAASGYATALTLATDLSNGNNGVAVDGSGNVFVADAGNNAVKEYLAAGGYTTVKTIGSGFNDPEGVALDRAGNLFVADYNNQSIKELPAAGGYSTIKTIDSSHVGYPHRLAVDPSGNIFFAGSGSFVGELVAAGGYTTVNELRGGIEEADGVAVDAAGNVFVADGGDIGTFYASSGIYKMAAAGGYQSVTPLGFDYNHAGDVTVDARGNVFVAEHDFGRVREILATPPSLVASVLPGARSVQITNQATLFATVINTGPTTLDNCRIAQPGWAPIGLFVDYQTTNPATNALTGTVDTPVSIAGNNGVQTFVVTFSYGSDVVGATPFDVSGLALEFACSAGSDVDTAGYHLYAAAVVPGVDTIDLDMSATPVADIIALSSTPSGNGVVSVSVGGAAAFAVATTNLGVAAQVTASADTGATGLPLALNICETNSATGQCLAPPAASVSLSDAGGAAPTFSIFVQATAAIAFNPAASRIFVRFKDPSGALHGSTSVAVATQ